MSQRSSYRALLPALCLVLALATFLPAPLAAQEPPKGADIVFLIDQSGSMENSDPLGLRFEGLQYAIDWLGRTILEYDEQRQYTFRVSVVDFGTYPKTVLDPMEIAPKNEELWQDLSKFMSARLARNERDSLGNTRPVLAFQRAAEIFKGWGAPALGRPRIIVLLTDGLPEPDSEAAMTRIEEYYRANFPAPDYQLYVIGLSSPESPWSLWERRWNDLSQGRATAVENRRVLGAYLQSTLGQITTALGMAGEQTAPCGILGVAPYLDMLRITAHNPTPDAPIKIFDAENRPINETDVDGVTSVGGQAVEVRGHGAAIESVTVYDPQPGNWRIECPRAALQPVVFVRQAPARTQVDLPGRHLALGVPYGVSFRLLDHAGKPLGPVKDPRFALEVRLSATAAGQANARPEEITLRYNRATQAYEGALTGMQPGEWTHHLVARTALPDGSAWTVAQIDTPAVQVVAPQTVVTLPDAEVGQLTPITLTLSLEDASGRPFTRSTENLDALRAEAAVVTPSETITVPLEANESGLYTGGFTPYAAGEHRATGFVYLLDPTRAEPTVIAQGAATSFMAQPLNLTATHSPARLSQLTPATAQLTAASESAAALALLRDLTAWDAAIAPLGQTVAVDRSFDANGALNLAFTPLTAGAYQPAALITLRRGDATAGEIRVPLGSVTIAAPRVITDALDIATAAPQTCLLAVNLLNAEGRSFAGSLDPNYTLAVSARPAGAADAAPMTLPYNADSGLFQAAEGLQRTDYLLDVVAQRGDTGIPLVSGFAVGQPICPPGVIPRLAGIPVWLTAIGAFLLLALVALAVMWFLKRRNPLPFPVDTEHNQASGYIVLERPRGQRQGSYDLGETGAGRQVWDPVEIVKNGSRVDCPVRQVEIEQTLTEASGEGKTGKLGARVRVFYDDKFDAFAGTRWIEDGMGYELKNQWWITFATMPPVPAGQPGTPLAAQQVAHQAAPEVAQPAVEQAAQPPVVDAPVQPPSRPENPKTQPPQQDAPKGSFKRPRADSDNIR